MGESGKDVLPVRFAGGLNLAFHGSRVTSYPGLLAYRELDAANSRDKVGVGKGGLFAPGQRDVLEAENGRKVVRSQAEPTAWGLRKGLREHGDER